MGLVSIRECLRTQQCNLLINYVRGPSCKFLDTFFDLLEGCPKGRVRRGSVELAEIIADTAGNWGGLRDMDE